jgi:putative membrane protein
LDLGLVQAQEGQQKLSQGADTLSSKVRTLTFGVRELRANLRTMTSKLPEDNQLDQVRQGANDLTRGNTQLHDGLQRLREGSHYLSAGIDLMTQELPSSVGSIEGSAEGLAHSVTPILEIDAQVANHGSGFAPNVIPVALWLGAGIAAFLVHLRLLPRLAQGFSPWALFAGKVSVPAMVSLLQAAGVLFTVQVVLGIAIAHPLLLAWMLALASLTFVCIVYALTRAFGDAGKAMAMMFLALQVSASGGFLPVELSGSLYAQISPWLPMTWVVMGVKACMFHAFEGDWWTPVLITLCWGTASACVACYAGRWRFVPARRMRPMLDV